MHATHASLRRERTCTLSSAIIPSWPAHNKTISVDRCSVGSRQYVVDLSFPVTVNGDFNAPCSSSSSWRPVCFDEGWNPSRSSLVQVNWCSPGTAGHRKKRGIVAPLILFEHRSKQIIPRNAVSFPRASFDRRDSILWTTSNEDFVNQQIICVSGIELSAYGSASLFAVVLMITRIRWLAWIGLGVSSNWRGSVRKH